MAARHDDNIQGLVTSLDDSKMKQRAVLVLGQLAESCTPPRGRYRENGLAVVELDGTSKLANLMTKFQDDDTIVNHINRIMYGISQGMLMEPTSDIISKFQSQTGPAIYETVFSNITRIEKEFNKFAFGGLKAMLSCVPNVPGTVFLGAHKTMLTDVKTMDEKLKLVTSMHAIASKTEVTTYINENPTIVADLLAWLFEFEAEGLEFVELLTAMLRVVAVLSKKSAVNETDLGTIIYIYDNYTKSTIRDLCEEILLHSLDLPFIKKTVDTLTKGSDEAKVLAYQNLNAFSIVPQIALTILNEGILGTIVEAAKACVSSLKASPNDDGAGSAALASCLNVLSTIATSSNEGCRELIKWGGYDVLSSCVPYLGWNVNTIGRGLSKLCLAFIKYEGEEAVDKMTSSEVIYNLVQYLNAAIAEYPLFCIEIFDMLCAIAILNENGLALVIEMNLMESLAEAIKHHLNNEGYQASLLKLWNIVASTPKSYDYFKDEAINYMYKVLISGIVDPMLVYSLILTYVQVDGQIKKQETSKLIDALLASSNTPPVSQAKTKAAAKICTALASEATVKKQAANFGAALRNWRSDMNQAKISIAGASVFSLVAEHGKYFASGENLEELLNFIKSILDNEDRDIQHTLGQACASLSSVFKICDNRTKCSTLVKAVTIAGDTAIQNCINKEIPNGAMYMNSVAQLISFYSTSDPSDIDNIVSSTAAMFHGATSGKKECPIVFLIVNRMVENFGAKATAKLVNDGFNTVILDALNRFPYTRDVHGNAMSALQTTLLNDSNDAALNDARKKQLVPAIRRTRHTFGALTQIVNEILSILLTSADISAAIEGALVLIREGTEKKDENKLGKGISELAEALVTPEAIRYVSRSRFPSYFVQFAVNVTPATSYGELSDCCRILGQGAAAGLLNVPDFYKTLCEFYTMCLNKNYQKSLGSGLCIASCIRQAGMAVQKTTISSGVLAAATTTITADSAVEGDYGKYIGDVVAAMIGISPTKASEVTAVVNALIDLLSSSEESWAQAMAVVSSACDIPNFSEVDHRAVLMPLMVPVVNLIKVCSDVGFEAKDKEAIMKKTLKSLCVYSKYFFNVDQKASGKKFNALYGDLEMSLSIKKLLSTVLKTYPFEGEDQIINEIYVSNFMVAIVTANDATEWTAPGLIVDTLVHFAHVTNREVQNNLTLIMSLFDCDNVIKREMKVCIDNPADPIPSLILISLALQGKMKDPSGTMKHEKAFAEWSLLQVKNPKNELKLQHVYLVHKKLITKFATDDNHGAFHSVLLCNPTVKYFNENNPAMAENVAVATEALGYLAALLANKNDQVEKDLNFTNVIKSYLVPNKQLEILVSACLSMIATLSVEAIAAVEEKSSMLIATTVECLNLYKRNEIICENGAQVLAKSYHKFKDMRPTLLQSIGRVGQFGTIAAKDMWIQPFNKASVSALLTIGDEGPARINADIIESNVYSKMAKGLNVTEGEYNEHEVALADLTTCFARRDRAEYCVKSGILDTLTAIIENGHAASVEACMVAIQALTKGDPNLASKILKHAGLVRVLFGEGEEDLPEWTGDDPCRGAYLKALRMLLASTDEIKHIKEVGRLGKIELRYSTYESTKNMVGWLKKRIDGDLDEKMLREIALRKLGKTFDDDATMPHRKAALESMFDTNLLTTMAGQMELYSKGDVIPMTAAMAPESLNELGEGSLPFEFEFAHKAFDANPEDVDEMTLKQIYMWMADQHGKKKNLHPKTNSEMHEKLRYAFTKIEDYSQLNLTYDTFAGQEVQWGMKIFKLLLDEYKQDMVQIFQDENLPVLLFAEYIQAQNTRHAPNVTSSVSFVLQALLQYDECLYPFIEEYHTQINDSFNTNLQTGLDNEQTAGIDIHIIPRVMLYSACRRPDLINFFEPASSCVTLHRAWRQYDESTLTYLSLRHIIYAVRRNYNSQHRSTIIQENTISKTVDLVDECKDNQVLKNDVGLAGTLAIDPEFKAEYSDLNAVHKYSELLRVHFEDPGGEGVYANTALTLSQLVLSHAKNNDIFVIQEKGLEEIRQGFLKHAGNYAEIFALASLATNVSYQRDDIRARFCLLEGGPQCICKALLVFSKDSTVSLVKDNAISSIMKAVNNFALYTPNVRIFIDNGIQDAFAALFENAQFLGETMFATTFTTLTNLLLIYEPDVVLKFVPVLPIILEVLGDENRVETNFFETGLEAVGTILKHPEGTKEFVQRGGIDLVVALAEYYINVQACSIVKTCLNLIAMVGRTTNYRNELYNSNVVGVIGWAQSTFVDDPRYDELLVAWARCTRRMSGCIGWEFLSYMWEYDLKETILGILEAMAVQEEPTAFNFIEIHKLVLCMLHIGEGHELSESLEPPNTLEDIDNLGIPATQRIIMEDDWEYLGEEDSGWYCNGLDCSWFIRWFNASLATIQSDASYNAIQCHLTFVATLWYFFGIANMTSFWECLIMGDPEDGTNIISDFNEYIVIAIKDIKFNSLWFYSCFCVFGALIYNYPDQIETSMPDATGMFALGESLSLRNKLRVNGKQQQMWFNFLKNVYKKELEAGYLSAMAGEESASMLVSLLADTTPSPVIERLIMWNTETYQNGVASLPDETKQYIAEGGYHPCMVAKEEGGLKKGVLFWRASQSLLHMSMLIEYDSKRISQIKAMDMYQRAVIGYPLNVLTGRIAVLTDTDLCRQASKKNLLNPAWSKSKILELRIAGQESIVISLGKKDARTTFQMSLFQWKSAILEL